MSVTRIIMSALSVGFLVDQFGYAGEYGGKILRSNDITEPAAPIYEGLGWFMHEVAWKEGVVYYYNGFRDIYNQHNP